MPPRAHELDLPPLLRWSVTILQGAILYYTHGPNKNYSAVASWQVDSLVDQTSSFGQECQCRHAVAFGAYFYPFKWDAVNNSDQHIDLVQYDILFLIKDIYALCCTIDNSAKGFNKHFSETISLLHLLWIWYILWCDMSQTVSEKCYGCYTILCGFNKNISFGHSIGQYY